jgi:hypothetical protein
MKENLDESNIQRKFLIKGMHLVRKMKEVREQDRREVLSELENVQRTIQVDKTRESRANIIENALNIVDRHQGSLAVGCGKKAGQHMSQLERNRIALGLLK